MLSRLRSRSDATDDDDDVSASSASRREGVLLSPSLRLPILLLLLPLLLLVVLPRAVSRLSPPDVPLQPQQANCHDCGVFMLMAADWVAAGLEQHFGYAQAHMPALRRYLALACVRRRVD